MRLLPVNRSTLLVELADLDEVLALHASLRREPLPGIEEMLPAARTLMLRFDSQCLSATTLAELLPSRGVPRRPESFGPLVKIPIRYDGEDLAEVARLSGLTAEEVIRRHSKSEFTVGFCGFAPGFAYLVGGDPALQVPRRPTPRTQVPAGSVALGGVYCGVYPQVSPGGWQIIGTTPMSMWDPSRDPPATLTPGTRVRFCDLDASVSSSRDDESKKSGEFAVARAATQRQDNLDGRSYITVTTAILPALIQDLGREGHTDIGVTASGALDRAAFKEANRAVGNPDDLPVLEIAFGSFAFRCSGEMAVALAGAPAPISIRRVSGEIFDGMLGQPIILGSGDSVTLGRPRCGVRTYLAVRGGFAVPRVLGSASRDTLALLGPEPLAKGALLEVERHVVSPAASSVSRHETDPSSVRPLPAIGDTVELDVFVGPRADWFSERSVAALCGQLWQVTSQSNRVGLRLRGAEALQRDDARELPSEGLVSGAIQVPHDGQPILLLADHPVTGGYPVIAVVAEHHLDLAGQLPPGASIRFRFVG
jgi:KipI family sensor histidine kinase inhibitor